MAKKQKTKKNTRFFINGKNATKPHKNSFLDDKVIEAAMKKIGAHGYIVVAYKKDVGTEISVKIQKNPEVLVNVMQALDRVKQSIVLESLPSLGEMLKEALKV